MAAMTEVWNVKRRPCRIRLRLDRLSPSRCMMRYFRPSSSLPAGGSGWAARAPGGERIAASHGRTPLRAVGRGAPILEDAGYPGGVLQLGQKRVLGVELDQRRVGCAVPSAPHP